MEMFKLIISILCIITLMPTSSNIPKQLLIENFISLNSVRGLRILFAILFVPFCIHQIDQFMNSHLLEGYTTTTATKKPTVSQRKYLEKEVKQDESKQEFEVNTNLLQGSPVWKQTGSFTYSGTGYVPDYEESIYLNDQFQSKPKHLTNTPYLNGGFCTALESTPLKLEDKCNTLELDTCASTDCCVLLGGQKCVKGNENGPYFKNNYSNFLINNKDYYYYQGKCFGNCPE